LLKIKFKVLLTKCNLHVPSLTQSLYNQVTLKKNRFNLKMFFLIYILKSTAHTSYSNSTFFQCCSTSVCTLTLLQGQRGCAWS